MKEERKSIPKIRHFLADGRVLESIEGYIVPNTGATATTYYLIAEFIKKHHGNLQQKEKEVNVTV